ncbi:RedY protein [Streptomyces longispororuber]|uniref:RedY protein n=1 Tax=Streptomyces longispororuber TaxID=68230 RepID=A0A919A6M4_9ACTN|nr:RedY protein [Streptomyces longispororuber]GHE88846.1 RedY protein [Streptomyces longispororuber]
MTFIVHRIRLHDGVEPERFESWVREVDYATCPELPSVLAFAVQRLAPAGGGGPAEYYEVVEVTGRADFERDTRSAPFRRLVADFEKMASVVAEWSGERVGPGYRSRGAAGPETRAGTARG